MAQTPARRARSTANDGLEAAEEQYKFVVNLAELLRALMVHLPTTKDDWENPVVQLSNLLSCDDFHAAHAKLVFDLVFNNDLNYDQYLNHTSRHIKTELQNFIATATMVRAYWLRQQGRAVLPSGTQGQRDGIRNCRHCCVQLLCLSNQFVVAMKNGLIKMSCNAARNATAGCIAEARAKLVADAARVERDLKGLEQLYNGASDKEVCELVRDAKKQCEPTQEEWFEMARTHGGLPDRIFQAGKNAADPFDRRIDKMGIKEDLIKKVKTAIDLLRSLSLIVDSDSDSEEGDSVEALVARIDAHHAASRN